MTLLQAPSDEPAPPEPSPDAPSQSRAGLPADWRKSSLGALAGLAVGVVLATGAGTVYVDQVEEDVRREMKVEIETQIQEFMTLASGVVTLYAELSQFLVRKAADAVYIVSAPDGSLSVDWETLKGETFTTSVMDNVERRILVLKSLGDSVAAGVKADIDEARTEDAAVFDLAPDKLIDLLLARYPDDPKLRELRARCDRLQDEVARLEDPSHWLGRSLEVIRRAVGLSGPQKLPADSALE